MSLSSTLLKILLISLLSIINVNAQTNTTQGPFTLFGLANDEAAFAHCLDGSGSGHIFAVGASNGRLLGQDETISGGYDWFILKYNRNNGYLTSNTNNPTVRWLLTPQKDIGVACDSDINGAVYVAGYTYGSLDPLRPITMNGYSDAVVAKYDANMNLEWIYQFNPTGAYTSVFLSQISVFGAVVYVAGFGGASAFVHAFDAGSGLPIWTSPTSVSSTGSTYVNNFAIDVMGNLIVTGELTGNIAGRINSYGETIPAATNAGSRDGFILGFDNNGVLKFQTLIGSSGIDVIEAIAIDVNQSIYVGGYVSGSVNGEAYQPTSLNNLLPFISKYNIQGSHEWTRILPQSDISVIRQIVVDNIGGIFFLRSSSNCYYQPYAGNPDNLRSSCTSDNGQYINLLKADINGAIQSESRISSGIAFAMEIDNTGLLSLSGVISHNNRLHGIGTVSNSYDGFIDTITINYNCSCGEITSLVQQMTQLLNIVPQ